MVCTSLQAFSWADLYGISDWSRKLFKPMNIDFAFKALGKLAIFIYYGGFEFDTVDGKKLMKSRKNAGN